MLSVGGQAVATATDPQLQAAVAGYNRYVHTQAVALVKRVQAFVAAVKAGDVDKAKARVRRGARPVRDDRAGRGELRHARP